VRSVDQRPNLRHLCEPLGGTEGLIKAVGFQKTTESMWWSTSANASTEWVPHWGGQQRWNRGKQTLCGHEGPNQPKLDLVIF